MTELRQSGWVGRAWQALARHRPYVVALLAVIIISQVPTLSHDDRAGRAQSTGGSRTATGGEAGAQAPGVTAPSAAAAADAAASSAQHGTAGPTGRGAAAVATPTSAGLGSAAALAAPDCDSARRRLKVGTLYAPSCAVPWPAGADNGGATTSGVTGTTIKVVAIADSTSTDQNKAKASWDDYVTMYTALYRTWGRKVETVWYTTTGTDEASQRADAIQIATMKPFAVLSAGTSLNGDVLVQELASRKIVVCCYTAITLAKARALAPYVWGSVLASPEGYQLNLAQYAGRRLVGHPAQWAGDTTTKVKPRVFGLLYPDTWTDLHAFNEEFGKSGAKLAVSESYAYDSSQYAAYQERARTVVAKMKAAGVTTVLDAGGLVFDPITTKEATSQQWFPEWVIAGTGGQDLDIVGRLDDQTQWRNAFGVASLAVGGDKPVPMDQLYDWYWGPGRANRSLAFDATTVLFTGIHGAGPRLTPQTFRDGLFNFPVSGGAASGGFMGTQVSFGRHGFFPWDDYNQGDDFAEVYWDPGAHGKDSLSCEATGGVCVEGVGKYRYLNGGKRYAPSQWPTGEPAFFQPDGTALWWPDYPPGDRPPSYPCTGCPSQGG